VTDNRLPVSRVVGSYSDILVDLNTFTPYPHLPYLFTTIMSARNSSALLKRARVDDEDDANAGTTMTISSSGGEGLGKNALVRSVKRTSGLTAPIVSLAGAHEVSSFWD
jgi:hypothetical protein